ncbi:MAG: hypothetical protein OXG52_08390 [bacterium]|nr:hypothetical protein [bacterium]
MTKIAERTLDESFQLVEPASNVSVKLVRRPDQIEEPGRVHLGRGVSSQLRKLFRVRL